MWKKAFDGFLTHLFRDGDLHLTFPDGTTRRYGDGSGASVSVTLHDPALPRRIILSPDMAVGEAYMDGRLTIENDDLYGFLTLAIRNVAAQGNPWFRKPLDWGRYALRQLQQFNPAPRARANVAHHYDLSGKLYDLFLDSDRQYSCAYFRDPGMTLDAAQKAKKTHIAGKLLLEPGMRVLDIGCGWGSALDVVSRLGAKEVVGITLSTEQLAYCKERRIPNATFLLQDYATYEPEQKYDALISIEMIDHLCSPAQQKEGLAVEIYRSYFNKLATWVKPGDCFGFQAILRNRIPRDREQLRDLQFTADVIFPGGLNPRIEELVAAISPRWELIELHMMRDDYRRTTAEWLRRFTLHEKEIRAKWGDQVFADYDRYLKACVRQFTLHQSGDVQMKLRRID